MVGGDPDLFDQVDQLVNGLIKLRRGSNSMIMDVYRPQGNLDGAGIKRIIEQYYDQQNGRRR